MEPGQSLQVFEVRPLKKCLNPTFFSNGHLGETPLVSKRKPNYM